MDWREIVRKREEKKQKKEREEKESSFKNFFERVKIEIKRFTLDINGIFDVIDEREFFYKLNITYKKGLSHYNLVIEVTDSWVDVKSKNYTLSLLSKCEDKKQRISVEYFRTCEYSPDYGHCWYANCRMPRMGFTGYNLGLVLEEFFRDTISPNAKHYKCR